MRYFSTIILSVLVLSCSEVVDFNSGNDQKFISIYAHFNNGTLGNRVVIERANNIGTQPLPISGAEIKVSDLEGNSVFFNESTSQRGTYHKSEDSFLGIPGKEYFLEVRLPNGKSYRSDIQRLPFKGAEDQLEFEVGVIERSGEDGITFEEFAVSLFAETQISSDRRDLYLKWDIESTWFFGETSLPGQFWWWMPDVCYMTDKLEEQQVRLFSTADITTDLISKRLMVTDRIDESFYGKQYYSLIQSTITKEAHNFWTAINQVANIQGTIFDPVLGTVPSNISSINDPDEVVLGFFELAHVDTAHVAITRDDVGLFYNEPCVIILSKSLTT